MTQPQLTQTNRKINLNTVITGLLVPICLGIFWKAVQIYNLMLLQPGIDLAQDVRINQTQIAITSLVNLADEAKNKNTDQDKDIIRLQLFLPNKNQFKVKR